jgi:hypothetical protein
VCEAHPGAARELARRLAVELDACSASLPRGPLSPAEHAALCELRARAALRPGVELQPLDETAGWCVALQAEAGEPPAPGTLRFVQVVPIGDLDALARWCRALHPHLSCVGEAGWGPDTARLVRAAAAGGASRVCALGRMQLPPLEWRRDGQDPIRSLLRWIELEAE